MDKAQIISDLTKDTSLKRLCNKLAWKQGIANDLYQHLFVVLLEYDEAKILRAYNEGYIVRLAGGIVINSMCSTSSPFAKQYQHLSNCKEINESDSIEDEAEPSEEDKRREDRIDLILDVLEQPVTTENFYRLTLLKEWAKGSSYRQISNKTKIPRRSIETAIIACIKEIRQYDK